MNSQRNKFISAPNMLLIGAAGRNAGKTELACRIIARNAKRHPVIGIKVTTVHKHEEACPRGGEGCGTCASLKDDYCINEETNPDGTKDTCRLLAAGAGKVYWLRSRKDALAEGFRCLQRELPENALLVCESNSLRKHVQPGVFFIVKHVDADGIKPSAKAVLPYADRLVISDGRDFNIVPDELSFSGTRAVFPLEAGLIIMAGGNSTRMGKEKCLLPIAGVPMIERLHTMLKPHFRQTLVSVKKDSRVRLPDAESIFDPEEGRGPLQGITAALKASSYAANLVIACDIPDPDIDFIKMMFRQIGDRVDGVIPLNPQGQYEPTYAVYTKNMLPALQDVLSRGRNKIIDAYENCRLACPVIENDEELWNINTEEDYRAYLRRFE